MENVPSQSSIAIPRKVGRSDQWILLISFFLFLSSSITLIFRPFDLLEVGDRPPERPRVGSVTELTNEALRRPDQDVRWTRVGAKSAVYENDRIFSGTGSRILLRMDDGTQLTVSSETLVTLSRRESVPTIDIERGRISGVAGTDGKLRVSHDGVTAEITVKDPSVKLALEVAPDGKAKIVSSTGDIEIHADKANPFALEIRPGMAIELSDPIAGSVIELGSAQRSLPVDFAWLDSLGRKDFELQIHRIGAAVEKMQITGTSRFKSRALEPGTYSWQVRALDSNSNSKDTPWSEKSDFIIRMADGGVLDAPELLEPIDGKRFGQDARVKKIRFHWEPGSTAEASLIEISRSADFGSSAIVFTQRLNKEDCDWEPKETGLFFWRVKKFEGKSESVFSSPHRLEIAPSAPELEEPDFQFESTQVEKKIPSFWSFLGRFLISPADAAETQAAAPTLRWRHSSGAERYRVEISAEPEFSGQVKIYESRENHFLWKEFEPGAHYWRVYACGPNNICGPPSPTGKFTVFVRAPVLNASENEEFSWQPSPCNCSYEVEVSGDKKFTQMVDGTHYRFQPESPGKYHVKIRAVQSGVPVSRYSNEEIFMTEAPNVAQVQNAAPLESEKTYSWKLLAGTDSMQINETDKATGGQARLSSFPGLRLGGGAEVPLKNNLDLRIEGFYENDSISQTSSRTISSPSQSLLSLLVAAESKVLDWLVARAGLGYGSSIFVVTDTSSSGNLVAEKYSYPFLELGGTIPLDQLIKQDQHLSADLRFRYLMSSTAQAVAVSSGVEWNASLLWNFSVAPKRALGVDLGVRGVSQDSSQLGKSESAVQLDFVSRWY